MKSLKYWRKKITSWFWWKDGHPGCGCAAPRSKKLQITHKTRRLRLAYLGPISLACWSDGTRSATDGVLGEHETWVGFRCVKSGQPCRWTIRNANLSHKYDCPARGSLGFLDPNLLACWSDWDSIVRYWPPEKRVSTWEWAFRNHRCLPKKHYVEKLQLLKHFERKWWLTKKM